MCNSFARTDRLEMLVEIKQNMFSIYSKNYNHAKLINDYTSLSTWRVPGIIILIGAFSWCKNAMCLTDISITASFSQILRYITQQGGYGLKNKAAVIDCEN